jgi:uncharacterized membrane protein YjgN (DUF898 family)
MPVYFMLYGVLVVVPIAAVMAIVLVALRRFPNVNASFGSKRFSFTLNASERFSASAPHRVLGMPDQSSADLQLRGDSHALGEGPGDLL